MNTDNAHINIVDQVVKNVKLKHIPTEEHRHPNEPEMTGL